MTDVKIEGKLPAGGAEAIGEHARALYDKPGSRRMAVVELRAAYNVVPAPGEDKTPQVVLRIQGLEVATGTEQENVVRDVQRALYLQRTAQGTLTEQDELQVSKQALKHAAGTIHGAEVARLRAALAAWTREGHNLVNAAPNLSVGEIRGKLTRLVNGLEAALHPGRLELEDA